MDIEKSPTESFRHTCADSVFSFGASPLSCKTKRDKKIVIHDMANEGFQQRFSYCMKEATRSMSHEIQCMSLNSR